MTEEQIASNAAQQECNNIISTLSARCIALAADLAVTKSRLEKANEELCKVPFAVPAAD